MVKFYILQIRLGKIADFAAGGVVFSTSQQRNCAKSGFFAVFRVAAAGVKGYDGKAAMRQKRLREVPHA